MWVATDDGVVHYNLQNDKQEIYKIDIKPSPYGDKIWSLLETNNDLYIATAAEGLLVLPFNNYTKKYDSIRPFNNFSSGNETLENTQIFEIKKSANGDIWLGTSKGLSKIVVNGLTPPTISFYRNNIVNNKSISSDKVYKVFIDKTNVLWCGTEVGLNKLDLNSLPFHYFTFANQKIADQVKGIYTIDGNNIWLSTFSKGFLNYNIAINTSNVFSVQPEQSFYNGTRSIFITNNNVWVGTLNGILKTATNFSSSYQNLLSNHVVFVIFKDKKQAVWVGTNNGLFKVKPDGSIENITVNATNSGTMPSLFVRSIFEDSNGTIWVGCENGGIALVDNATNKLTIVSANKRGETILGSTIYTIAKYPKNTIWLGAESGLTKIVFPAIATTLQTLPLKPTQNKMGCPINLLAVF